MRSRSSPLAGTSEQPRTLRTREGGERGEDHHADARAPKTTSRTATRNRAPRTIASVAAAINADAAHATIVLAVATVETATVLDDVEQVAAEAHATQSATTHASNVLTMPRTIEEYAAVRVRQPHQHVGEQRRDNVYSPARRRRRQQYADQHAARNPQIRHAARLMRKRERQQAQHRRTTQPRARRVPLRIDVGSFVLVSYHEVFNSPVRRTI